MKSFREFLLEMSRNLGKSETNYLHGNKGSEENRKKQYRLYKDDKLHSYQIDHPDVKVHTYTSTNPHKTIITSLDHKNKVALHQTTIHHEKNHDTIDSTYRVPKGKLPARHVQNLHLDYVRKSERPLVASEDQHTAGHHMWRNMAHAALDSGMHVHYSDGKRLHKSNKENIEHHLNSYFAPDGADRKTNDEFANKRMIISKNPIKATK